MHRENAVWTIRFSMVTVVPQLFIIAQKLATIEISNYQMRLEVKSFRNIFQSSFIFNVQFLRVEFFAENVWMKEKNLSINGPTILTAGRLNAILSPYAFWKWNKRADEDEFCINIVCKTMRIGSFESEILFVLD